MQKQKEQKSLWVAEISILVFIWLIIFAGPVIFQNESDKIIWQDVFLNWRRLVPFLILTLFNHLVLVPFIFFKKHKLWYFASAIVTVVLFVLALNANEPLKPIPPNQNSRENSRPFPPPKFEERGEFREMQKPPKGQRPLPPGKERSGLPPYLNSMLISILILGFDTGLRTVFKWTKLEQEREVLEKEKVKTELAFLKNQISPHFFMNTLNNIHALIDVNSEDAKESIIKLSKLMRYVLYDTEQDKTTLYKEIEFIKSYVDLMKLRFTSKVNIELSFPETIPETTIPPMLFTSLVENSFKHGISYQEESFVGIYLQVQEKDLHFRIKNSIHKNSNEKLEKGGLGLSNLKKRLELLYGSKCLMTRDEKENSFEINIKLPLND
jgi:hypothetical protein